MSPQRRAALVSVVAAATLLVLKLAVGLTTHSLGLVSEAIHSGTDLVAALLTFFAVRVAARPADVTHQFGHGKAEHLSALAEAGFLSIASVFISYRAVRQLTGSSSPHVNAAWYAFAVLVLVLAVDASRTIVSWRTSRQYVSPALAANALHFGSDFAGTVAVLIGLGFARAGHPDADPIAALFVGVLVLLAAARLIRRNTDVLMDRAPEEAEEAARLAIEELVPTVELRRLRMRSAAGRQFADVVIGVPPSSVVGQGHAAADAVEAAVEGALPGSDVVVHVEPIEDPSLRERAHAAALAVPRVREVHNLVLVDVAGLKELSLHVKLPGSLSLEEAHAIAEQVEDAIRAAVPEIQGVQTHLEPLTEAMTAREVNADAAAVVLRVVQEATGSAPRALRFLRTVDGLVAFLTLGLDGGSSLADAHARASTIEERIRRERPDIADVIVHTEP
jgi:cation diffusion facilitator family transporter